MFIDPMLLATAPAPFSDSHYLFEPKIDGHRLLFSQQSGRIRLYTRHETECNQQYPELLVPFDDDILLDGEVACTGPEGVDFEEVMTRFKAKKDHRIKELTRTSPVTYVVFDILQYKGEDLRKMPLMQRKEILAGINMQNQQFGVIPFVEDAGEALFNQMVNRKLEGMVGKRKNSLYVSSRSPAWQKVINWSYTDVIITGYRKDEFGLLAAVLDESGRLRPAGIIEYATQATRKEFYSKSQFLVTGEDKKFVYLNPTTRGRVKFRNWFKSGMLRTPVLTELIG
ncbi:ATP-dependent DNA ligase [Paenibacillus glucanolyticus]|uniref:ATP-dependent DNA ligase n=1 Tax=Paenibacillus glucanolyticus TaxID=59843 RepID=A0A163HV56_9BACL|nr:ATP-dependent DNA ligase [Paenibacillus glucanolyticus]KZS45680.1 ATP-dependent DNA ligase [Paenibacillus glucanolyticus]